MGKRFTISTVPLRAGFRLCLKRSMPERSPDNSRPINAHIHTNRLCIHHTASIAASAILETTVPYCIEIGAGVVIGEGCWLHACSGDIILEPGTVLGTGVLIVGWSRIGTFSIIGSSVTVFEVAIDANSTIAAHSVWGLPTRELPDSAPLLEATNEVDNLPDPWDEPPSLSDDQRDVSAPLIHPPQPEPIHSPQFEAIAKESLQSKPIPPIPPECVESETSQPETSQPTMIEPTPVDTTLQTQTSPEFSTPFQINHPSTFTPFIRSWKRPSSPRPLDSSPATPLTESPGTTDQSRLQPDAPPATTNLEQTSEESYQDEPTIISITDTIVTQSISQPTNSQTINSQTTNSQTTTVYGRQHVNRIIDSILRRSTPEE